MKKINTLLILLLGLLALNTQAQPVRYLDQVFDEVTFRGYETGLVYGQNASIILLLDGDPNNDAHPLKQPLVFDLYTPTGDTETERPLVIVFHSGNFLPFPVNLSTSGTLRDSAVVETCTRLAKMGYVVASADYRLGWNPLAPTQDERVYLLINAAYRGVQDARTAIRFFKKTAAEDGNPFGIDPDKITLWGIGTGGYITLNTSSLDAYNKVLLPKFITLGPGGTPVPMVIEPVNGDIEAKSYGFVVPGYPIFTPGDTLCYPNWVNYSSDFQLSVNLGGACGDSSWVDPGQPPMISFHDPGDQNAPYVEGIVNVPGVNLPVVEVQGSYLVQKLQNEYGNNDVFNSLDVSGYPFMQAVTDVANSRNDGFEGLSPLPTDDDNGAPWDFYSPTNPNATTPPDPVAARLSFDTIMAYFAPRACLALGLDCAGEVSSARSLLTNADVGLVVAPNPANDVVSFNTVAEHPMLAVQLFDIKGNLVKNYFNINTNSMTLNREHFPAGMYIVKLWFEKGITTQKLIFR